ncbi:hypothetical protein, partial [Ruegeria atlantica]|uniref:hypothetical protein n=2 Tax=Ruegeria TaxID=97050 RepID=UPI001C11ACBD
QADNAPTINLDQSDEAAQASYACVPAQQQLVTFDILIGRPRTPESRPGTQPEIASHKTASAMFPVRYGTFVNFGFRIAAGSIEPFASVLCFQHVD